MQSNVDARTNYGTAIQFAIEACETKSYKAKRHFRGVTKMVSSNGEANRGPLSDEHSHKKILTSGYQLVTCARVPIP